MSLAFLVSAALFSISASASAGTDLVQCYQSALKRSETVADQDELITQAEEHYQQAIGGALPTITGTATYLVQDNPNQSGISSTVSPSAQPLVKLTLAQPLFRGLREFAGIRQTSRLTEAQKLAKAQAELLLFNDVAVNFYTLLTLEQDLRILGDETGHFQKRIHELEERTRIGRSRVNEALTVETSLAQLRAQIEQTEAQLRAAREAFAFLTGLARDTRLEDPAELPGRPDPLDAYLARLGDRPDVRSASARVEAFDEAITVARGGHYPSLDLTGNYYLKRYGVNEDVKWDVQLGLTLPIYAGGTTQSHVREAASQQRESELALNRARRASEQEIRTFYENVVTDRAQLTALAHARELSERNYSSQVKDYRLGLVTNLDVLQALTTFQESERALARAGFNARLNFARLQTSTGRIPAGERK